MISLSQGVQHARCVGEPARSLKPVAEIYIRLMQMTVLPYLVVALIMGFGQLRVDQAKRIALRGGAILLVTWAAVAAVITATSVAFPHYESASFFSHTLVEPHQPLSIPDLYFTSNPFHSLSNAVVPAVVLFSSMIGIGLIGLPDRDLVLRSLQVLNSAITRITHFVIELTPLGVFAIGAETAGTMDFETFQRLQVYFVTFAAAALVLAFWILPLLATAVTPFRYREVVTVAADALLTAFAANNAFVVLPILSNRSKKLLDRHGLLTPESDSATEILIPILYNFPNAGRLLTLLFVPFAAWLSGSPLASYDYGTLFLVGIPSYFAKAQVALPFLLDLFDIPHDLFQLYIPSAIITGKLDSMVTAMNLLIFALWGSAAMGGFMVLKASRIVRAGVASAVGIVVVVLASKALIGSMVDVEYHKDETLLQMHSPRVESASVVNRTLPRGEQPEATAPTLASIRERGAIRVGYDPFNLPFTFFNQSDELVGFDADLAERFAEAIGVKVEFFPVAWNTMPEDLKAGRVDMMAGVWYRPYWFGSVQLSRPYLEATVGLVVRDSRRHDFRDVDSIRAQEELVIGTPLDKRQLEVAIRRYFDGANVRFVTLNSLASFFQEEHEELDGFVGAAEAGAAWTLIRPEYTVVVPQPNPVKLPIAWGLAPGSDELAGLLNEWIEFAEQSGEIQGIYDYWVLGAGAEAKEPRWSIMRNVLGWEWPN